MQTDLEIIGFSSIEELQPFYDDFLDYTYFEKTAYGCTISSENFERYVMQALGELLEDVPAGQVPTLDFDGHAKFFVSNGVLSGELVELTAGYSQSINQAGLAMSISMSISETAKVTCTDYGSTVIERPNVG